MTSEQERLRGRALSGIEDSWTTHYDFLASRAAVLQALSFDRIASALEKMVEVSDADAT